MAIGIGDCTSIHKGDVFLCFRTVKYENNNAVIFQKGKTYTSYYDGTIIDEDGNRKHSFTRAYWEKCLIKINNTEEIDLSHLKDIPLGDKLLMVKKLKSLQKTKL